ncbi:MAG: glycosyltransferase family 1 protein [Nitrososphaerota archaeon]|nr:glycosyltransferase family 1 protein [Nitrososphaerota archaeon]
MTLRPTFWIMNHFLLPTPYNHRFFVEKFARGFKYSGFEIKVARKLDEIRGPGFVMISNHPFYHRYASNFYYSTALSSVSDHKVSAFEQRFKATMLVEHAAIRVLARRLKEQNIVLLAWMRHSEKEFFDRLDIPVIFTGEYHYGRPVHRRIIEWYDFYCREKNALPVEFAADVDPARVGANCENTKYLVSYVGNRTYGPNYYSLFRGRDNCRIVPTPPYIPEDERISIYRQSRTALGLSSEYNVVNKVVTERRFESLAYGAICLTDNIHAVEATHGCAIAIQSEEHLLGLLKQVSANKDGFMELRQQGFQFIRDHGTYAARAKSFVSLAEGLFGFSFRLS